MSDAWHEFSKLFSPVRHHFYRESKNRVIYLPKEIQRMVLMYLRPKRNFTIQDMGSVHGTYI